MVKLLGWCANCRSQLCPSNICEERFVISTLLSPLTSVSLPLFLCTLSRLWFNLTFKGEVIIMSLFKLQMVTASLVLIHHCSDSNSGRRKSNKKKNSAVTQTNWTRRTTRMKNKTPFCLFVGYPTVVTLKQAQPATCVGFMHMD